MTFHNSSEARCCEACAYWFKRQGTNEGHCSFRTKRFAGRQFVSGPYASCRHHLPAGEVIAVQQLDTQQKEKSR